MKLLHGSLDESDRDELQRQMREHTFTRQDLVLNARLHGMITEASTRSQVPAMQTQPSAPPANDHPIIRLRLRPALILAASLVAAITLTLGISLAMGYHEIQPKLTIGSILVRRGEQTTRMDATTSLRWTDTITTDDASASIRLPHAQLHLEAHTRLTLGTATDIRLHGGTVAMDADREFRIVHDDGTVTIDHGRITITKTPAACSVTLLSGTAHHLSPAGIRTPLSVGIPLCIPATHPPMAQATGASLPTSS